MRVVGRSHEEGSSLPGRRPGNHLRPSKCKAWATLVPVLPTRGLSPLNQQKSTRAQTRNSGKALLGPCCSRGVRGQKQVPLAPPPRGLSCFLIEVRIGACRAAGQRVAWVNKKRNMCNRKESMGFSRQEYWSGLPFPSPGEAS